jgi:hypothetical protein
MSESWFDGTDVDDIPDNPNELPNNTYKFRVTAAQHRPTKDNTKTGITFKYQIVDGPWSTFFPLVDWVQTPNASVPADEKQRLLSYLKMRLIAFGFDMSEIQSFGPATLEKCLNREFYGTTNSRKNTDGTVNIKVVKFDNLDAEEHDNKGGYSDSPNF